MIVLGYVGDHAQDTLLTRAGWAITRVAQRGVFEAVTHVEACFGVNSAKLAHIGSASLRDGGVRVKHAWLTEGHWIAINVPTWNTDASRQFIEARIGDKYDTRGALATVLLGGQDGARWFCNEIVGASVGLVSPEIFGPAQFMSIALSMPDAHVIDLFKKG